MKTREYVGLTAKLLNKDIMKLRKCLVVLLAFSRTAKCWMEIVERCSGRILCYNVYQIQEKKEEKKKFYDYHANLDFYTLLNHSQLFFKICNGPLKNGRRKLIDTKISKV